MQSANSPIGRKIYQNRLILLLILSFLELTVISDYNVRMKNGFQRLLIVLIAALVLACSCVYQPPALDKYPVDPNPIIKEIPPLSYNNLAISYGCSTDKAYLTTSWFIDNGISGDPQRYNLFTELYEITGPDNISNKRIYAGYDSTNLYHYASLVVSKTNQVVVFLKDAAGDLGCWTENHGLKIIYKNPGGNMIGPGLGKSLENGHFLFSFNDASTSDYYIVDYVYDSGDFKIVPFTLGAGRALKDLGGIPGYGYYALTYNGTNSNVEYLSFRFGETTPTSVFIGFSAGLTWGRVFLDSSNTPQIIMYNSATNLFSSSSKNTVWQSPKNIATLFSLDNYPAIQEENQFHIIQAPLSDAADYQFYSFAYSSNINTYSQNLSKNGLLLNANNFSGFCKLQYPIVSPFV